MKRTVTFLVIALTGFESGLAYDNPDACLRSTFESHVAVRHQLLKTVGPIMSPDAQITRRRLDESYCLKVTACGLQNQPTEVRAMMESTLFSSCLRQTAD